MIETITEATGIKKAVEVFSKVTGIDCGCDERKKKLNELFPINRTPKCMIESQFETWKEYRETRSEHVSKEERQMIAAMHADLFSHKYVEPCTCSPKRWVQMIKDLDKVFEAYGDQ